VCVEVNLQLEEPPQYALDVIIGGRVVLKHDVIDLDVRIELCIEVATDVVVHVD
jgi:hypothetical protein